MTGYTADFYRMRRAGDCRSADAIVPIVLDRVRPRSVIDVGRGVRARLARSLT